METEIQLTAVFIANGMAVFLAVQLLLHNDWHFAKNNIEYGILQYLVIFGIVACVVDPLAFWADGRPGTQYRLLVYGGNTFLFLDNVVMGAGWLVLVCIHLTGTVPAYQKYIIAGLGGIGLLFLLVNLVTPTVYYVDENSVYHREQYFWLYTAIESLFIVDGIVLYQYAKRRGGILKFFPVLHFIIPAITGILLQSVIYGISLIFPAMIISLAGVFNSLRNEALHMDSLTGLYNRSYLDIIERELEKKSTLPMSVLMLDMNSFKEINDQFGHAEGDAALKRTAGILRNTVGTLGCAIRYAGDEFVILLNTIQQEEVDDCISAIHKALSEENELSGKGYALSVAVGCCIPEEQNSTLDKVLSEADRLMYFSKQQYYSEQRREKQQRIGFRSGRVC